ncbi:hypothetical protein JL09_g6807 [Pichia kudriavzevii]|uniref:Uncharacterized protein n=1 Tax=Pichia kudriavzevii TaxID=4909 RepID=A0A099NKW3_PICKU|nr:hypothetical protein JL09_g6807 [Pichia kudriavzevii]
MLPISLRADIEPVFNTEEMEETTGNAEIDQTN